jgi:DNA-binding MarR family transcriptional regulator
MSDDLDLRACRDCLCLASRRAARAMTRAFDRRLRPQGMRVTQFSILTNLLLRGALPVGKLADALGMERTTLTRNLALLESKGWVQISADKDDARSRVVAATRRGRSAVAAALPAWRAAQAAVVAAIGAPGADALRTLAGAVR